jgi:hypothetical protein
MDNVVVSEWDAVRSERTAVVCEWTVVVSELNEDVCLLTLDWTELEVDVCELHGECPAPPNRFFQFQRVRVTRSN